MHTWTVKVKTPSASRQSVRIKVSTLKTPLNTNQQLACAIHAQRYPAVVEHCRKFIVIHQFDNEPLRMLCACLASGYRATDAFIASTLQKHLFREMRLYDTAVHNKDVLKWNTIPHRWGMNKSGEADEGADDEPNPEGVEEDEKNPAPPLPTKDNPAIFALYGHICLAGKSYQSAICAWSVVVVLVTGLTGVFSLPSPRIRLLPK